MNLLEANGNLENLSGNETFKARSCGFYGPIAADLSQPGDHFSEESEQLLKHHGTYQQDNRDSRKARSKAGLDKEYYMMLRTKFPGGRITREQYLLCDELCDKYGQHDLRITSRQCFQFHGVVRGNLRPLIYDLNKLQNITSIGACGDIVRNTMAPAVADIDLSYKDCAGDLQELAYQLMLATLPTTKAYYDIWLNDEKVVINPDGTYTYVENLREEVEDPLYGCQYLPRKFKIGLGTDFDNSVDMYTNDVGIMGVTENGRIIGYEILAGGGLGFSHTMEKTYPRAASHVAFVQPEDVVPITLAIIKVQRDYGDRTDRKQARLKYTIDRMGVETFIEKIYEYAGRTYERPRNVKPTAQPDYLGWHKQQNGDNYVGVWIENGRLRDFDGGVQFKTAVRKIVDGYCSTVRLTPHHNLVLAGIKDADVPAVQAIIDQYGIPTDKNISPLRRYEMACPALPLCGLAQSEAERYMPKLMEQLENAGFADEDVMIRMTGCPNGCARSSSSEIGLIGKGPGRYTLCVGGDYLGTRVNQKLISTIKEEDIAPTLSILLSTWKDERNKGEYFGDWSARIGVEKLRELVGVAEK